MFVIVLRILRDKAKALGIYSFFSVLLVMMFATFLPTIADQAEEFEQLYSSFPPALFEIFGLDSLRITTLEKFLSVEFYSIMWPILAIVFAVGLAGTFLAQEIEKGTIEHLLSKPQSRTNVFLGKYFGGALLLLAFTAITAFSAIPIADLFDVSFNADSAVSIFFLSSLLVLTVFSLAMLFSALSSEKGRASMLGGGLFLVMYVVRVASILIDDLEWLQYFSFFYYYDYEAALLEHTISVESLAVFVGTVLVATLAGAFVFDRRDIAT